MINLFCSKGSKLVSLEQSSHLKHIQYLVHCTTRDIIRSITTHSLIVIISWWLRALSKVCSGKNVQIMTRKVCELLPLAQPYHHESSPQALQYHQGHHQEDLEYLWYYVVHRILGRNIFSLTIAITIIISKPFVSRASWLGQPCHLSPTQCHPPSSPNVIIVINLIAKSERDWHQRVSILWNSVLRHASWNAV